MFAAVLLVVCFVDTLVTIWCVARLKGFAHDVVMLKRFAANNARVVRDMADPDDSGLDIVPDDAESDAVKALTDALMAAAKNADEV